MHPFEPWKTEEGIWFPLELLDRETLPLDSFPDLVSAARAARTRAYAPYSKFCVGAALIMDGEMYSGCNVENASYGATICAERNALFHAVSEGGRRLEMIAISTDGSNDSEPDSRSPCGMCRQVMAEFSDDDTVVLLDCSDPEASQVSAEVIRFSTLLPLRFQLKKGESDPTGED